jgi:Cu/Ag efflux protein CusF
MRDIARLSARALPGLLLSVLAVPVPAQLAAPTTVETGRGWGVATTTTTTAARVAAIDPGSRRLDVLLADGRIMGLVAGSDVRRLDQVRVGDVIDVTFVESLVLELRKNGGATVARSEGTDMRRGPSGSAPSAVRQTDVTIIADVVAVDEALGTVTLRGPKATMALRIRDPKQLALVKPGDQVQATYTEAVAVSIDTVR